MSKKFLNDVCRLVGHDCPGYIESIKNYEDTANLVTVMQATKLCCRCARLVTAERRIKHIDLRKNSFDIIEYTLESLRTNFDRYIIDSP